MSALCLSAALASRSSQRSAVQPALPRSASTSARTDCSAASPDGGFGVRLGAWPLGVGFGLGFGLGFALLVGFALVGLGFTEVVLVVVLVSLGSADADGAGPPTPEPGSTIPGGSVVNAATGSGCGAGVVSHTATPTPTVAAASTAMIVRFRRHRLLLSSAVTCQGFLSGVPDTGSGWARAGVRAQPLVWRTETRPEGLRSESKKSGKGLALASGGPARADPGTH
ncbi:hypothetical protein GCM10010452_82290 [Crossiella cryophila]